MIEPADLTGVAAALLSVTSYPEAAARRAVSTAYYALFHAISGAGSALFDVDLETRRRIAGAYDHRGVSAACRQIEEAAARKARGETRGPDPRLVAVARVFNQLREARESADYDLTADLSLADAAELVESSAQACASLQAILELQETRALLLSPVIPDRPRRG